MIKKLSYSLIVIFLFSFLGFSQRNPLPQNYKRFDKKLYHFGFMLGINTSDLATNYKGNLVTDYGTYSIQNKSQPGFQLGLLASLKLGSPMLRLRFIPSISFQERILNYTYPPLTEEDDFITQEERIGSTNLDFPLLLKFRTLRYNNFAAYVIGGAQYSVDLQSKEKTAQKWGDPFIKLFRDDFQAQVGGGVDFFFSFFKFSIELKFSHGFKNALLQDNTRLSSPINSLHNKVWLLSFTFEG